MFSAIAILSPLKIQQVILETFLLSVCLDSVIMFLVNINSISSERYRGRKIKEEKIARLHFACLLFSRIAALLQATNEGEGEKKDALNAILRYCCDNCAPENVLSFSCPHH